MDIAMENKTIESTPVTVRYHVWDVHPGCGGRKRIVSEETHVFPNPNGERFLKAAGRKYSELMAKWNGPTWERRFIFARGAKRCRYEVQYEYLDGHLR